MAGKSVYGVGLDAGSRTTRMVITAVEQGRVRLLGIGASEAQGWVKGRIADSKLVSESIRMALREAEAAAQVSVEQAVVGIGGKAVRGANTRGILELGYVREIDQRDVNRVVNRATRVQLSEDRMILQLFPQDFVVDDHPGHRDPRGMVASRLEVNVHLITASSQEHYALVGAVNQAHLSVEESVFEGLAAAYAAVQPEERRQGIAVIDVGAESTQLIVFYGETMQLVSGIPVCGDHFTKDLAQVLCLSFEDAELVKREYGGALADGCPDNVMVEVPMPDDREQRHVQRKLLNQILEARSAELFRLVRAELARVGMDHALLGGVFLTGAAARLPDLCDVAERVLQCPARFGLAVGIRDWPENERDPEWAAAAGLALYSAKLKMQAAHERESAGWLGRVLR
ncbi:MAG TPA: cell division protein FtsA [Bryobacteraceae bacterium]|nr:cell division protein FtsA [Bryobacteraceae bacterium]